MVVDGGTQRHNVRVSCDSRTHNTTGEPWPQRCVVIVRFQSRKNNCDRTNIGKQTVHSREHTVGRAFFFFLFFLLFLLELLFFLSSCRPAPSPPPPAPPPLLPAQDAATAACFVCPSSFSSAASTEAHSPWCFAYNAARSVLCNPRPQRRTGRETKSRYNLDLYSS